MLLIKSIMILPNHIVLNKVSLESIFKSFTFYTRNLTLVSSLANILFIVGPTFFLSRASPSDGASWLFIANLYSGFLLFDYGLLNAGARSFSALKSDYLDVHSHEQFSCIKILFLRRLVATAKVKVPLAVLVTCILLYLLQFWHDKLLPGVDPAQAFLSVVLTSASAIFYVLQAPYLALFLSEGKHNDVGKFNIISRLPVSLLPLVSGIFHIKAPFFAYPLVLTIACAVSYVSLRQISLLKLPINSDISEMTGMPCVDLGFTSFSKSCLLQGLSTVSAYLSLKSSSLFGSFIFGSQEIFAFSLLQTSFNGFLMFSQLPLQLRVHEIIDSASSNNKAVFKTLYDNLARSCFKLFTLMSIAGILSLFLIIRYNVVFLRIGNSFLPLSCLFAVVYFLELRHSLAAFFINCTNKAPFVVSSLLTAVIQCCLMFFLAQPLGVLSLIVSQGLAQISYNNWRWPLMLSSIVCSPDPLWKTHG